MFHVQFVNLHINEDVINMIFWIIELYISQESTLSLFQLQKYDIIAVQPKSEEILTQCVS